MPIRKALRDSRARGLFVALAGFVLSGFLCLIGLSLVTFAIGRIIPIDPILTIIGDHASPEAYANARNSLGLDRPLAEQYFHYLLRLLRGDLGNSVITANPVVSDLVHFFPATFELATIASAIGILIGVPFGVMAGAAHGGWLDRLVRLLSLLGHSVPVFWLGLVGLALFYAKLGWVAGPGRIDVAYDDLLKPVTGMLLFDSAMEGEWDVFSNAFRHLVLPAAILGFYSMAYISRLARSFMIEQLDQQYVIAARAKGCSELQVVWHHAFPNILVPLLTVIGSGYASLLEGAVLTETVFAWPGLGRYLTQAVFSADMNAVLGGTLLIGTIFIGINLSCDLLYRLVDRRACAE